MISHSNIDMESADFFQLVLMLEKYYQTVKPDRFSEVGDPRYLQSDSIRFSVSSSLAFPTHDIDTITHDETARSSVIEVNFMGLHGASSPLPSCYTEKLAGRDKDDNPVKDFLDFFHNRYLALIYKAWKKYKYHVQFRPSANDAFSQKILHFVGLTKTAQQLDCLDLDKAKLLSYIAQLSTRTRSPKLIAGVVAHYFSLKKVRVEEWILRKIEMADDQKNMLSRKNCYLGTNYHLGQTISDVSGKFNLHIEEVEFATYIQFTPNSHQYQTLLGLMAFILRDPLAWDLVITVNLASVPKNSLGHTMGNTLGKSCWLGTPSAENTKVVIPGGL
ncbi:type VI secretion system baseplate subunit TssG [Vibrio sp. S4M6]|uniref:type VI secretion system baseplate subunit TssG n=1 Tax=Vibrio sinus TaxID=2946865 RepID=UPI00202A2486|nr:type VI secretion system baseplate subunit TssG [Vibrio sinus]MCL9783490.1 type VI secretion system baseplate subunit TssG [Vibrio sinus]